MMYGVGGVGVALKVKRLENHLFNFMFHPIFCHIPLTTKSQLLDDIIHQEVCSFVDEIHQHEKQQF